MTLEKATEILDEVKELDDSMYAYNPAYMEALEMALSSMEEIQKYREIGASPERLKELIFEGSAAKRILCHYQEIGTVEECREAREKQKSKKPVKDKWGHNCCPSCGWVVSGEAGYGEEFCPHCENCGQAIRWENLEEMEE